MVLPIIIKHFDSSLTQFDLTAVPAGTLIYYTIYYYTTFQEKMQIHSYVILHKFEPLFSTIILSYCPRRTRRFAA